MGDARHAKDASRNADTILSLVDSTKNVAEQLITRLAPATRAALAKKLGINDVENALLNLQAQVPISPGR